MTDTVPQAPNSRSGEDKKRLKPRIGPNAVESEEALLGSLLIAPDVLPQVSGIVQPDDFFELRHEWIYKAILTLAERIDHIDLITVGEELRRHDQLEDSGGTLYLAQLANTTPTYLYAETYATNIRNAAIRRRLLEAAGTIADLARNEGANLQEEVFAEAERVLFTVTGETRQDIVPISVAVQEFYKHVEEIASNPNHMLGVPSGFRDLDNMLSGLQKSDLIIVAARPGVGKTSFMLSVALHAAKKANARIAIFSLEMGREQLVQRLYSIETKINSHRLRQGQLEEYEWDLFNEATTRLDALPIYIDDTPGITIQQMRARCRRLAKEVGLDMIVVDYLQLLTAGVGRSETNRVQEISYISRSMKEIARELKVPLLSAAQLSRAVEQRADKRPMLSDLRESGSIEQDSDVVMFLYRDEMYNQATEKPNQAEVIVAKHRNGPTGKIELFFRKELTQFLDLEKRNVDLSDYG